MDSRGPSKFQDPHVTALPSHECSLSPQRSHAIHRTHKCFRQGVLEGKVDLKRAEARREVTTILEIPAWVWRDTTLGHPRSSLDHLPLSSDWGEILPRNLDCLRSHQVLKWSKTLEKLCCLFCFRTSVIIS